MICLFFNKVIYLEYAYRHFIPNVYYINKKLKIEIYIYIKSIGDYMENTRKSNLKGLLWMT